MTNRSMVSQLYKGEVMGNKRRCATVVKNQNTEAESAKKKLLVQCLWVRRASQSCMLELTATWKQGTAKGTAHAGEQRESEQRW